MTETVIKTAALTDNAETSRDYSIGELAEEFSITYRTIRYYEDEGLLRPHRRGPARVFSDRDRRRLGLILRGKRLGFSLVIIREFLDLYIVDANQIEQMRFLLRRARYRRAELLKQIAQSEKLIEELNEIENEALTHLRQHNGLPPNER